MFYWILFAVVITTAIFLYLSLKMKQKEIHSTQELLLQFIDQFEEQHQEVVNQFEQYKQLMDEKYENVLLMLHNHEIELTQNHVDKTTDSPSDEHLKEFDPLHIKERYGNILRLQQEGKTVDEIARITGKGKGEIILIIELLEKQLEQTD